MENKDAILLDSQLILCLNDDLITFFSEVCINLYYYHRSRLCINLIKYFTLIQKGWCLKSTLSNLLFICSHLRNIDNYTPQPQIMFNYSECDDTLLFDPISNSYLNKFDSEEVLNDGILCQSLLYENTLSYDILNVINTNQKFITMNSICKLKIDDNKLIHHIANDFKLQYAISNCDLELIKYHLKTHDPRDNHNNGYYIALETNNIHIIELIIKTIVEKNWYEIQVLMINFDDSRTLATDIHLYIRYNF